MSFDLNLATVCNHKVFKESVTLDTDRRSLRVTQPLAASVVDVYASDNLVPKSNYSIIYDPASTVPVNQPRMISLNKRWRSTEDYFQVSYVTLRNFCPKCAGMGQVDDVSYNVRGDFLTVRNENLLMQNMEKFTVTELQSNPFQPFIGTNLVKLIGQRVVDTSYLTTKITSEISTTLNVLKSLQNQYKSTKRASTAGEQLDQIESVKVSFDPADPSILRADIKVRAVSGKSVDFTQLLKVA